MCFWLPSRESLFYGASELVLVTKQNKMGQDWSSKAGFFFNYVRQLKYSIMWLRKLLAITFSTEFYSHNRFTIIYCNNRPQFWRQTFVNAQICCQLSFNIFDELLVPVKQISYLRHLYCTFSIYMFIQLFSTCPIVMDLKKKKSMTLAQQKFHNHHYAEPDK